MCLALRTERFRLGNLSPQPGSRKRNKRKGRGIAAGQGASCGFGMRGQKSRSGSGVRPGFEGGQMPLYRRLPKLKGIAGGTFWPAPSVLKTTLELHKKLLISFFHSSGLTSLLGCMSRNGSRAFQVRDREPG